MCYEGTAVVIPLDIGVPGARSHSTIFQKTDCIPFFGHDRAPRMLHELDLPSILNAATSASSNLQNRRDADKPSTQIDSQYHQISLRKAGWFAAHMPDASRSQVSWAVSAALIADLFRDKGASSGQVGRIAELSPLAIREAAEETQESVHRRSVRVADHRFRQAQHFRLGNSPAARIVAV